MGNSTLKASVLSEEENVGAMGIGFGAIKGLAEKRRTGSLAGLVGRSLRQLYRAMWSLKIDGVGCKFCGLTSMAAT